MKADIDIDFADRTLALGVLKHVRASRKTDTGFTHHNTGVYLQKIPYNPIKNLANIDYKTAADRGYFKLDFLNVNMYKDIKSEEDLTRYLSTEPMWELLEQDEFSELLFHVNGHGAILREMKPHSIPQLAAVLAMIRPAKRYLIGKSWPDVMAEVWIQTDTTGYSFRQAHAMAYAAAIVVQMNQICEQYS